MGNESIDSAEKTLRLSMISTYRIHDGQRIDRVSGENVKTVNDIHLPYSRWATNRSSQRRKRQDCQWYPLTVFMMGNESIESAEKTSRLSMISTYRIHDGQRIDRVSGENVKTVNDINLPYSRWATNRSRQWRKRQDCQWYPLTVFMMGNESIESAEKTLRLSMISTYRIHDGQRIDRVSGENVKTVNDIHLPYSWWATNRSSQRRKR